MFEKKYVGFFIRVKITYFKNQLIPYDTMTAKKGKIVPVLN
jgi:hypothetical protein